MAKAGAPWRRALRQRLRWMPCSKGWRRVRQIHVAVRVQYNDLYHLILYNYIIIATTTVGSIIKHCFFTDYNSERERE